MGSFLLLIKICFASDVSISFHVVPLSFHIWCSYNNICAADYIMLFIINKHHSTFLLVVGKGCTFSYIKKGGITTFFYLEFWHFFVVVLELSGGLLSCY